MIAAMLSLLPTTGMVAGDALADSAQPAVTGTWRYEEDRFSIDVPDGWRILVQGEGVGLCLRAWDPENPGRTFFVCFQLEPFIKSEEIRGWYESRRGWYGLNALFADAPVMEAPTLDAFLECIPSLYSFCDYYEDQGVTIRKEVLPEIAEFTVLDEKASPLPALPLASENHIARISCLDYSGQLCEAQVMAQPLDLGTAEPVTSALARNYLCDFYRICSFAGVMAPEGELDSLHSSLIACLSSMELEEDYIRDTNAASDAFAQESLAYLRRMDALTEAMVMAWNADW